MTKELLSVGDLSEYLNIKKSTIYRLVENGHLPHYKIGRLVRCKRSDLDAWLEKNRRERIETDKKAKEILKGVRNPEIDAGNMVKKIIEEAKDRSYTLDHGKPDQSRGLRKEVENGTL